MLTPDAIDFIACFLGILILMSVNDRAVEGEE